MRIIIVALFLLTAALCQGQPKFDGTWVLKDKVQVAGPEYLNALPTQMYIIQDSDSLIIESITIGADGKDTKSRQAIALNGKPYTRTSLTSKRKYIRNLGWSVDKQSLMLTTVFYVPENENEVDFTRVEIWDIKDGQLQVHKKSIEGRSESWEVKSVFERK